MKVSLTFVDLSELGRTVSEAVGEDEPTVHEGEHMHQISEAP